MRLFIAIELPDALKNTLTTLQTPIPTTRWVKPGQMHLTLRFIGEVSTQQAEDIKLALDGIDSSRFDLQLQGVGRFPQQKKKAPRVLWVGVAEQPALVDLQGRIENALHSMRIPADNQAFHPHITLARLNLQKPVQQVDTFLQQQAKFAQEPFTVDRFVLIESTLSSQGPVYRPMGEYALR